jgi:hypothetical protein
MQNHDASWRDDAEAAALAELAAQLDCDGCGGPLPESPFVRGVDFFCDPCALAICGVEPVVRVKMPALATRRTP